MAKLYNCNNCPAYCCSYEEIVITKSDIKRLARWFDISKDDATRRFTKAGSDPDSAERILKHRKDEHFGSICRFLDPDTRGCSVYQARPEICRSYPGTTRCGYYDFLMFERRTQDDPEWVATTNNGR